MWEPDTFANRADNPLAEHRTAERGEEGNLERQLVLTFTAEGGIRNKPTRQELEELVVRSRSLNCHLLASELVAQLEPRALSSKLVSSYFLESFHVYLLVCSIRKVCLRLKLFTETFPPN